jgi:hypothetical protein
MAMTKTAAKAMAKATATVTGAATTDLAVGNLPAVLVQPV